MRDFRVRFSLRRLIRALLSSARALSNPRRGQLSAYLEDRGAASAALSVGRVQTVRDIERSYHSRSAERAGAPGASSAPQDRAALGPPSIVLNRVE